MTKKLIALVEALREAGQRHHDYTYINMVTGVKLCPAAPGGEVEAPCMCGAKEHNFSVDAAAKALVAEIEKQSADPQERLHKAIVEERNAKAAYYAHGHRTDAIAWDAARQELEACLKGMEAYDH